MPRGTPIEGWWAWWPFHGEQYARRFATDADAYAYLPTVRTKHGKPYPLGPKYVMRVAFDMGERGLGFHPWTCDEPILITQEEVAQQWATQQVEQERLKLEREATVLPLPLDERPATPPLEYRVTISQTS